MLVFVYTAIQCDETKRKEEKEKENNVMISLFELVFVNTAIQCDEEDSRSKSSGYNERVCLYNVE